MLPFFSENWVTDKQADAFSDAELTDILEIVGKWRKMPLALQKAVLSIIRANL